MISTRNVNKPLTTPLFIHKKLLFSIAVLVIFHAVGFWGMVFSTNPHFFQNLTPYNLLLTGFLLFLNHPKFDRAFFIFVFVTFIVSFLAEVIGVHTGLLFGNYWYGAALGFKLWNVPLVIGLNWILLLYSTGILAKRWTKNAFLAAFIAALLLVALDFFIEPVAMKFDFWDWQNHLVPVQNYAGWLILAFGLQLFFQFSPSTKKNALAGWVVGVQAVFFIALNLFL